MSCITISNAETQNTSRIFLTPTKRKRVTNETRQENHTQVHENMNEGESPSIEEVWRWTMTPGAVATCFVKDLFDMKENLLGGADFYWLGRVPCRSVRLVGLVVGVQVYESRILYSIDDGTAVVDCAHRAQRMPKSPTKKPKSTSNPVFRGMPVPIARVGRAVSVVGKIHRVHDTRQVQVEEIEVCKSANEEPIHWMKVRELHRTNYDVKEPFIIPPPSAPETSKVNEPATPATVMSTPSSSVANSPVKLDPAKSSPPKLRHPSRLHSRDLIDNTFLLYVKHYMIHAPDDNDDDDFYDEPNTPTKCRRTSSDDLLTPRQRNGTNTPRPHVEPRESESHRGFTLSYLRRVPELADLARRVVLAEAKRRSREQRKKENERRSTSTARKSASVAATHDVPKEKLGPKMKRLFEWAIVQMLREGSMVLWDGPMRTCDGSTRAELSRLWKTSTSISTSVGVDSTVFSRSCGVVPDIIEEVSEPEVEEEGYMPITPLFLGNYVETAIRELASTTGETGTKPVSKLRVTRGPTGAAKEGILRRLHRDDRWRYIGEWQVEDALEYLQGEKRAWCIGQDRWELTL
ncbi:hypothetical protein M378DRAFT_165413 [Amanita muscaria Koide BX008]|uniref:CST complex subunit STN1 n=1 Tax=Amanita muscaria (strain Koide BX008) TaxID=946122 RepID=A0A0C2X208_AMAMK|nr:hypothetical protein M378DRAFT_165413 [Amanita muscaria Koide BX008]